METSSPIARRVAGASWRDVESAADEQGWSRLPRLLSARECRDLVAGYERDELYRSTVDMERYRFGSGQYRYFAAPLPAPVQALRRALYARLAPVANRWATRLGQPTRYPTSLDEFLSICATAGQTRPTPLLLRYGARDYNCLHQDLYGAVAFPLQVLIMLSQHGSDYDGGEVILVEQRPRAQSRAFAIALERGTGLVFTNRRRPAAGARGFYAVQMRHGTSPITRGRRFVLGIIFHDAA